MNKLRKPSIIDANYFYLFVGVMLLFLGTIAQGRELYTGLIITEYLLILLPTILFILVRGYSFKDVFRLNKLNIKQILIIPLITILVYPVGVFLNYVFIALINQFSEINPVTVPIPQTGKELLFSFIIIALSAGICEEALFRGLIMSAYERIGVKNSIFISAVLFGLFHFNIQNLVGPIFLGIVFGYIVYKTNSIFSSMIAHTTNNAVALILGYFVMKSGVYVEQSQDIVSNMPSGIYLLIGAIFLGIIALVSGTLAFILLKNLPKTISETKEYVEVEDVGIKSNGRIFLEILPLLIILIIFSFVTYKYITM